MKVVASKLENGELNRKETVLEFQPDTEEVEMQVVNLYPQIKYQEIEGFGGALTEAAGYTLSRMSKENYKKIVDAYYGEEGIGYSLIRTHIDSCDFSLGNYSAVEDKTDEDFRTFSLERDASYIQPLIRAAIDVCPGEISVLLSPWSPPAFMKTNGEKNHGGKLKEEYYGAWALYICKYIHEYRALGFPVKMITIQNEPKAVQLWDSCVYTAEEEKVFLRDYLKPALIESGLEDIKVIIWDHNKERVLERAMEIIDEDTDKMVDGVAFHWYSGDHFDALRMVKELYPDKQLIFSEGCVEYSRFGAADVVANAEMYGHDIIGNLNAGMNSWFDWNIALDEKGGPNHVGNYCDAPVMCDTQADEVEFKLSFIYIGHFSRYIKPGAKRIGFSQYTSKIEMTAFMNTDGSIAVVIMNPQDEKIPIVLRMNNQIAEFTVDAHSISTCLI